MRSSSTLQLAVALIRGKCSKYTNVIYISTETQLLIQYFLPRGETEREERPLHSRRTQKQNSKAIGNYDELPAPDGEIMRCSLAVANGSRRESIKEAAEEGEHNSERRRKESRAEGGGKGAATSDLSGAQSGATKC